MMVYIRNLIFVLFSSVVGEILPIISPHDFFDGQSFTAICDYQRLDIDPAAIYIDQLILERKTLSDTKFVTIATYSPFQPSKQNVTHIPSNRTWNIAFSGGQVAGPEQSNVQTIKIVLEVNDARCTDVGEYMCTATTDQPATVQSPVQNLTADAAVSQDPLSMNLDNKNAPFYSENSAGENVTLTCVAYGPSDLILKWWYRPKETSEDKPYPITADITYLEPTVDSVSVGCTKYRLETILAFTLQDADDGNTYYCAVYDHTTEFTRENFTIGIMAADEAAPQKTEESGVNVGAVVGGVIAGVVIVYIAIQLLYCLWYKKRAKKNSDSENSEDAEKEQNGGIVRFKLPLTLSSQQPSLKSESAQHKKSEVPPQESTDSNGGNVYDSIRSSNQRQLKVPTIQTEPKRMPADIQTRPVGRPAEYAVSKKASMARDDLDMPPRYDSPVTTTPGEDLRPRGHVNRAYNEGYISDEPSTDKYREAKEPDIGQADPDESSEEMPRRQAYNREDRQRRRESRNSSRSGSKLSLETAPTGTFI